LAGGCQSSIDPKKRRYDRRVADPSRVLKIEAFFVLTYSIIRIDPAVERLSLMDRTRIEAFALVSLQKRATLRHKSSAQIVWIAGINRQLLKDVLSFLLSPAHYVFMSRLKGAPMNDAAVSGTFACVRLQ
jgi:hypothetical protein